MLLKLALLDECGVLILMMMELIVSVEESCSKSFLLRVFLAQGLLALMVGFRRVLLCGWLFFLVLIGFLVDEVIADFRWGVGSARLGSARCS